ncbi:hypothetical protein QBC47DRAFT_386947 [Echria macrotheca]|uniref:Uncharacterized protein n=1 Tax=Echria macrotheca TaxID=438768 RepID=A0AAJ0F4R0_9PEZI|nr:hypothetical protein QBC47DRAFT_386947 [Echria macrotheca]
MKDKQLVNLQTQLEGFRTNQRDKDGEKAAWTSTVQSLEADKARLESENEMLSQQLHQLTSEGVQCLAELEDTRTDLAKAMERISHMMEVQGTSISSVPATADQEAQTSSEVPAESSTPKPSLSPRTRGDDFQASRPQSEPVPQIPSAHQDLSKANRSDKEAQRFSEPPAQTSASQPFLQLTASGSEGSPSKKADETPVETQPQSLAERSNFEESRCPQRLQQDQNLKWDFSRLQIPRSEDIAPAADGSGHQVVPTDNTTQGGESTPHEALAGMFQFQFKGTQGSSPEARVRSSRVGSRTKAGSLTRNAGTPTPTPTTGKISAPDMRKTRQATKALAPAKKKPVRRSVRFSDSPCPSSKAESLVVEDDGPILDEIVVAP